MIADPAPGFVYAPQIEVRWDRRQGRFRRRSRLVAAAVSVALWALIYALLRAL